jgi:tetratricopeptide (TPR) repeat protein
MSEESLPHSVKELNRLHLSGKYAELIKADRANLAFLLDRLDRDHRDVGIAISRLAWSLYQNGDFGESEQELLQGMSEDVGRRDDLKERNACFLLDLANIYFATKRYAEADAAIERAGEFLRDMQHVLPATNAKLLYYIARSKLYSEGYDDAERLLREAIQQIQIEGHPKDRALGIFYHWLSRVYAAQAKLSDAMEAMGEALNAYPARETAYYANSLSMLGSYLAKSGDIREAKAHQTKALEILHRVRPSRHRDILAVERRLAAIEAHSNSS